MAWYLLGVLVLSALAAAQNRTRCFECSDVPHPASCNTLTSCPPDYKCTVEKIVTSGGLVLYNSGCMSDMRCSANRKSGIPQYTISRLLSSSDNVTCSECCDGEFCNNAGCGETAPPRSQRGPLCYSCYYESDPHNCRTVRTCDISEVCMLAEMPPVSGASLFQSNCQMTQVCQAYRPISVIGKRRAGPYCHVCCNGDFCNDHCPPTTK